MGTNNTRFGKRGLNLLVGNSRFNAIGFDEKLALARWCDVLEGCSEGSVGQNQALLEPLLKQSPFNDPELLKVWCNHYQIKQQHLSTLLSNEWMPTDLQTP
ncbi:MAG: hypothetical protein MJK04_22070, partial [Psychrosphaera sp.]|nr:hypothetical protein [Psychrosphaera sp.]